VDSGVLSAAPSPAAVYLASLSKSSQRTMAQALDSVAKLSNEQTTSQTFAWETLRYEHTQAIRSRIADTALSLATKNRMIYALRGVLKACWRLSLITADEYQRAVDIKPIAGSTLPRGRSLEHGELRELFAACKKDDSPAGRRDAALLAVLYGGGLRRSEVASLDISDFNRATGELKVLSGKGNKDRLAYATNGSLNALAQWLAVRGETPGPLFCSIRKGGRVEMKGMTDQAIYGTIQKRAAEAGLNHFSPHDLRRTFVGDMLDAGADVSLVQQLAGHANVSTTLRYDRRPEGAKRKAAELLHVPFKA
jgi:site-specific recombinase XerD